MCVEKKKTLSLARSWRGCGCDTPGEGGDKWPLFSLGTASAGSQPWHGRNWVIAEGEQSQLLPGLSWESPTHQGQNWPEGTWGRPWSPKGALGAKVGANLRASILCWWKTLWGSYHSLITMPAGVGSYIITLRIFINIFKSTRGRSRQFCFQNISQVCIIKPK